MTDRILICQGRPVDDDGQPVGEPCGRTLTVHGTGGWTPTPDSSQMMWQPHRPPSDAQVRDRAIAAGWSMAGPPMCAKCRRPYPAIAKGL